jgi:hypothetical protein
MPDIYVLQGLVNVQRMGCLSFADSTVNIHTSGDTLGSSQHLVAVYQDITIQINDNNNGVLI